MDPNKLKELAAESFGIPVEEVTEEHTKAMQAIADKLLAKATPSAPNLPDPNSKLVGELEERLLTAERQLAEFKRPELDPDEAARQLEKDQKTLARVKSLPDITTAVLDETEGEEDIRAFRRSWDVLHTLATVKGQPGEKGHAPVRTLKYWQRLQEKYPALTDAINKAIDTATTAEGLQWAPSLYSTDLQQSVYDQTTVARQFPRITAPSHSWVLPFSPTGGTVYLAGEALTADPANYTETTPTSAARTITAKKLMCRVIWSDEFDEDSIVAAASLFQAHTSRLMAEAIDSAIMNGDTTATHMDTGMGYTSTSPEVAFDGLRDIAKNGMSNSSDMSSTGLTGDKMLALIDAGTAKFVGDPSALIIFTSPKTRGKWFPMVDNATNKNQVYMRSAPMGDDLVARGAFMDFYGTPVIPTATLSCTYASTGLWTGASTYTAVLWCNKNCFLLTDRKEIGSVLVDQPLTGQKNVLTSWRGSFNAMQGTSSSIVYAGYGYGIAM